MEDELDRSFRETMVKAMNCAAYRDPHHADHAATKQWVREMFTYAYGTDSQPGNEGFADYP